MNLVRRDGATVIESAGLAGTATDPSIAQLSGGNIVAVWSEVTGQPTDVSDDTDGAIFGQILDPSGQPVGDIFQANNWTPFVQDGPELIAFANGGFGIGWTSRALFGDSVFDNDVFFNLFNAVGERAIEAPIDVALDNPGQLNTEVTDISFYSFGQYGVSLSDGSTILYDTSSRFVALVTYKPAAGAEEAVGAGDTVQLRDTNIVSAVPSRLPESEALARDDIVSIVLSNSRFDGPDGIDGVIDDLIFDSQGAVGEAIAETKLAALPGGGFALSYRESRGLDQETELSTGSVVRLEFYTSYGSRVSETVENLGLPLENDLGGHDMISLDGGGVAVAVVTSPGGGGGTDVQVLLFDEDGALVSRRQAALGVDANQSQPDLEQLEDGRIALTFTDASGREVDGKSGPIQLTFFDVTGDQSNYEATADNDSLAGLAGPDEIAGLAGDDTIVGRGGSDTLLGGAGNDNLSGGDGRDGLRGGAGDDSLTGNGGADGLSGGAGNDLLNGGAGDDVLGGGVGDDTIRGGAGADLIKGGAEADRIEGQGGADTIKGGAGADRLFGNGGADRMFGGADNDRFTGGGGNDAFVFRPGQGDDTITDYTAADRLVLSGYEAGDISLSTGGGNTVLDLGADSVTLLGVTLGLGDIDISFG